jgi:hypothetical protein
MTVTYESLRAKWPRHGGKETLSLRSIVKRLTGEDPLVVPDYQRSAVWTDDQCARFIGFLVEGGEAPSVYVQRWPLRMDKPDEILDGLQRITAIRRFLDNEVPLELTDGTRMYLRDFDPESQRLLTGNAGPTVTLQFVLYDKRADVLDMYLRLNRGGTPHSDEEIERVVRLRAAEPS